MLFYQTKVKLFFDVRPSVTYKAPSVLKLERQFPA